MMYLPVCSSRPVTAMASRRALLFATSQHTYLTYAKAHAPQQQIHPCVAI